MSIDRRIRKTQSSITQATVQLLMTIPMNKLTIKEICHKADVSRSTFYLHFYDASDVIEKLYNDISQRVSKMFDSFDFTNMLSNPKPFLLQIVEFIRENIDLYQLLLLNDYHSNFRRRLKKILEDKVLEENSYRFRNRAEFEYTVGFVISGLVECICDNIKDLDGSDSIKLVDTLTKQISNGFNIQ